MPDESNCGSDEQVLSPNDRSFELFFERASSVEGLSPDHLENLKQLLAEAAEIAPADILKAVGYAEAGNA